MRLNGEPISINALPAVSRDYEDSGEQKVSPLREPSGGRELKRYSRSVTGAENLEVPVNDVEKLAENQGDICGYKAHEGLDLTSLAQSPGCLAIGLHQSK